MRLRRAGPAPACRDYFTITSMARVGVHTILDPGGRTVIVRSRDSKGVWRLSTESEPVDGRTDTIAGDLADGGVGEVFVSSFSLLSVECG